MLLSGFGIRYWLPAVISPIEIDKRRHMVCEPPLIEVLIVNFHQKTNSYPVFNPMSKIRFHLLPKRFWTRFGKSKEIILKPSFGLHRRLLIYKMIPLIAFMTGLLSSTDVLQESLRFSISIFRNNSFGGNYSPYLLSHPKQHACPRTF